jgi:hypothetical protein
MVCGMKSFPKRFVLSWSVAWAIVTIGCADPPAQQSQQAPQAQVQQQKAASRDENAKAFDLDANEKRGGHVLARHVGKTDAELKQRLDEEPNISAASTYTDKKTAEEAIAAALEQRGARVDGWVKRRSHPNLVLDYYAKTSVGRTLRRGETTGAPCLHSIVVLKWEQKDYYVLTSYPECR